MNKPRPYNRGVTCDVDTCTRPAKARGWCLAHYNRWYSYGDVRADDPIDTDRTPAERFWDHVTKTADCWLWTAFTHKGYPRFMGMRAHAFAYTEANGPIPEGMTLDHLCCTRNCVNPAHLEVVTLEENARRGHARRKVA